MKTFARFCFVASMSAISLTATQNAFGNSFTIDFDTLNHASPAQRVYQEDGPGGFTMIRIPDESDPATFGNHFHVTDGNSSPGHSESSAAEFASDDGAPFLYYFGDYTGNSNSTYAPDLGTFKPFSLDGFEILALEEGPFVLTSSSGATLNIDHVGIYNAGNSDLSGFQGIQSFRHDYAGSVEGGMVIDDIRVTSPVPEPATLIALGLGAAALLRRKR